MRIWPLAALVVYLAPIGTFPTTPSRGSPCRWASWRCRAWCRCWPHPKPLIVAAALAVMTVPGFVHKVQVAANSIHVAGDPFFVFPDEVRALKALESDPRAGGVLSSSYAGYMVPYRTGRESYTGPLSWTPDWRSVRAWPTGSSRAPCAARRRATFVRSTNARFVFEDCRPGLANLEPELRPLLARVLRFGCASVYELRFRPAMARAAGPPDS